MVGRLWDYPAAASRKRGECGRQRRAARGAAPEQRNDVPARRLRRRAYVAHPRLGRARERGQQADAEPRSRERAVQRGVVGAMHDPRGEPAPAAGQLERGKELRAGDARDPWRVGERAQVDGVGRGVRGGQDEQQRLRDERVVLEPAGRRGRDVVIALGDEDVELPEAQQREAILGFVLADRARQLGVARADGPHRRDGEEGGRRGKGADDDLPAYDAVVGRELGLGRVELGEDAVGARDKPVGRGREPDPAPVAFEQRHPGLALEQCERLGDRRRGVSDGLRDPGDRSLSRELAEEPEPADVKHR